MTALFLCIVLMSVLPPKHQLDSVVVVYAALCAVTEWGLMLACLRYVLRVTPRDGGADA